MCNGVVNCHLIFISKVGFQDLWISGVIEMMTPLNLFCFGDGGPIWTPIEKLVQIRFSVQGVSKSSTPFKVCGKTPLPYICFFINHCRNLRRWFALASLYRWGSETLPHINPSSHFTIADDFAHCTRLEMGRVFSLQPAP